MTLVLLVFAGELIGLSITDTTYFLGFFFWMDLIGTLTILMDLSWVKVFAPVDATKVEQIDRSTDPDAGREYIFVRSVRAAKLGARAGRLTRVLKIVRYITADAKNDKDQSRLKVAKVISNQLNNVLSSRVALLSICVVIVMPLFDLLTYPSDEDSMSAWARLLNRDAEAYYNSGDGVRDWLDSEVRRFNDVFRGRNYGPFEACVGAKGSGGEFVCTEDLNPTWRFQRPQRNSSIKQIIESRFQAKFNLATPDQEEGISSIGLIVFCILTMVIFGLVISHSIGVIALQPLERLLTVVRERCAQIFQYTDELQDESNYEGDEYADCEHESEFLLLERVVGKLANIVTLMSANKDGEVNANMNEDEIMAQNYLQGSIQVQSGIGSSEGNLKDIEGSECRAASKDADGLNLANLQKALVESVARDDFNSLDLSKEQSLAIVNYLVVTHEACSSWVQSHVKDARLAKFTSVLESHYLPNPFHNFAHGLDVTYSCARFMRLINAERFIPETSQFWVLIAAIGHDVGHMGINNQYLIETSSVLAVKYNDRSPLENMHCSMLFECATDPDANIFEGFDKDLYKEMRKGMITAILHTDITKHNEMIKEMVMLYQVNSELFDNLQCEDIIGNSAAHLQLALNMILHGADVANPMKPWEMCRRLAFLCLNEFFAQGDLEKQTGIPVQLLNDRDKVNPANSQIGFIEFLIAPFCEAQVLMFPQLDGLAVFLAENIQHWSIAWQEEVSPPPESVAKVNARVAKVAGRCHRTARTERGIKSE